MNRKIFRRLRRALSRETTALMPGWYRRDGEDVERWHDQYDWSEHTRPLQDP